MSHHLPAALLNALESVKGFERESFEAVHASGEQVTSIRINPRKISQDLALSFVENIEAQVPWCPQGRYLKERPSFTFDPLLHGGAYYVQEASSMFLWHVLEYCVEAHNKFLRVLDLCAAPGGKSTLLASFFSEGLVVSNDVIRSRSQVLAENVSKWGSANVVVTNNDPQQFAQLESFFDVIVVDAPCSGSGLFRKDPNAIDEWSEATVSLCSKRQQRIIADVYDALKPGGLLIYSTCSYSEEEDESIAEWISNTFDATSVRLPLRSEWGIAETCSGENIFGYRFFPGNVKGEGFFITVFRKQENEFRPQRLPALNSASKNEIALLDQWVDEKENYFFFNQAENIVAVPQAWQRDVALLQKKLYLRKAGVTIGVVKGKSFVPNHELALSFCVGKSISFIEVSKEEAIKYLQKKEVHFETAIAGWSVVRHNGINTGWVKVLHNRVNNYYPTEWRILKD